MTGLPPSAPGGPAPDPASQEPQAGLERPERRQPGWREFRTAYPGLITAFWVALIALLAADGWLAYKGREYGEEAARLRLAMTGVERRRADVVFAANKDKVRVIVELARPAGRGGP